MTKAYDVGTDSSLQEGPPQRITHMWQWQNLHLSEEQKRQIREREAESDEEDLDEDERIDWKCVNLDRVVHIRRVTGK